MAELSNVDLTIVTVTFRDLSGLRATIESTRHLVTDSAGSVEMIVIDGGSGPDVINLLKSESHIRWVSEPDSGIYDGMNKGLDLSKGRAVWFLNGGDTCAVTDVQLFIKAVREYPGRIIYGDYAIGTSGEWVHRRSRRSTYIWHGLPTSHQAILYPGDALRNQRYDLSYRITGDYAATASLLRKGIKTVRVPIELARFALGGTSQQSGTRLADEASRVQREILEIPATLRIASRLLHHVARVRRSTLTRRLEN